MHWRQRRVRRPPMNIPGHAHELAFSCFHGYQFPRAERTCQGLADAVDEARSEVNFQLWAYVFMPEHVHLLIYPNQGASMPDKGDFHVYYGASPATTEPSLRRHPCLIKGDISGSEADVSILNMDIPNGMKLGDNSLKL